MRKSIKRFSRTKGLKRTRRKRLSPPRRRNRSNRRVKLYTERQLGGSDATVDNSGNPAGNNSAGKQTNDENNCNAQITNMQGELKKAVDNNALLYEHLKNIYTITLELTNISNVSKEPELSGGSSSNESKHSTRTDIPGAGTRVMIRQQQQQLVNLNRMVQEKSTSEGLLNGFVTAAKVAQNATKELNERSSKINQVLIKLTSALNDIMLTGNADMAGEDGNPNQTNQAGEDSNTIINPNP